MKTSTAKFECLQLLQLLLLCGRCESLAGSSLSDVFFPFGSDEGDSVVPVGDDNCEGPINLPYKIFNKTTLYICTNGLVSFVSYTSIQQGSIPQNSGPPFIAVNWYNFRTYQFDKGRVYYRSTTSDSSLLAMASRSVQHALVGQGFCEFQSKWVLVVTWYNVPYDIFNGSHHVPSSSRNTFQLVLTSDSEHHVMIFNYRTTPNIGTVGYDSRDGHNYFQLFSNQLRIGTNADSPGRWVFRANRLQVRLAGNEGKLYEGRLEVFYNGSWGTVCSDDFTDEDAKVFCFHLGFGHSGQYIGQRYGNGSGNIWLDNVACVGHETDVSRCRHSGWGIHNCDHHQDVSISCFVKSDIHERLAVRLAGSQNPYEGRVEILENGTWSTVCDTNNVQGAPQFVCFSLGFGMVGRYLAHQYGPGSGPIWRAENFCEKQPTAPICLRNISADEYCDHSRDVSLSCTSTIPMRLVGSNNTYEGRLEVFHNGNWGTVCSDLFTNISAKVACNLLGYGYVGYVLRNVNNPGSGPIWLDNVECKGCETRIDKCTKDPWGIHNCKHTDDVSISCYDLSTSTTTIATTESTTPGSDSDETTMIIVIVVVLGVLIVVVIIAIIVYQYIKHLRKSARERAEMASYYSRPMTVSLDDSMIPETYDNIADDQTYDRIEDPATYTATETIQDAAAEQAKAVESDADDQDYKPGNDYAPSSPGSSIYLHTV